MRTDVRTSSYESSEKVHAQREKTRKLNTGKRNNKKERVRKSHLQNIMDIAVMRVMHVHLLIRDTAEGKSVSK